MILALLLAAAAPQTAIDAERAFVADAQTLGQWTAFRKYAADDAVMIPMFRVLSSVTVRAMTIRCPSSFPGRKKAQSGPGAACGDCPDEFYVVEDSIDVSNRPSPRG